MFASLMPGLMCTCSGGKERAGTIESDTNWEEFQSRLLAARRKEKTVFVSLDMDAMVPYRRGCQSQVCLFRHCVVYFVYCLLDSSPRPKMWVIRPPWYV